MTLEVAADRPERQYHVINTVLNEIEIPEKGILSETLFNDENVKIVLFGFAPGQELTAHTAPMPASIQILRGAANITLGGESLRASEGCLIHMLPQLTHGIVAETPLLMLLTLIKAARQR